MSGGTEEHSEQQKLKQQCTETNYSEIQRSKVEVLSMETILTHSNTMYETYFSEKMPNNDPQHQKQVLLIEYFYKEHMIWPQLAVLCIILSNCHTLWCDGKSSSLILFHYLSSLIHLKVQYYVWWYLETCKISTNEQGMY